MKKTLYYNPLVTYPMKLVTWLLLKITGWKLEGEIIPEKKAIIIGAPHSSNWDLILFLCIAFTYNLKAAYLVKQEAFRFPFKWIVKWSGALPVNRNRAGRTVFEIAKVIKETEEIYLAIMPDGTRTPNQEWKTGFYHIAMKAEVPFQTGCIDYQTKTVHLRSYYPVGDLDTDIAALKELFYDGCRKDESLKLKEEEENKNLK